MLRKLLRDVCVSVELLAEIILGLDFWWSKDVVHLN
jgi:hypothetical protein